MSDSGARHRAEFEQLGILRLPAAFSSSDAELMRVSMRLAVEQEYDPRSESAMAHTSSHGGTLPSLDIAATVFEAIGSSSLLAALDAIFGEGEWVKPRTWGYPLITLPNGGSDWNIPTNPWHLDFLPRRPAMHIPGVRIFAFIDLVEPRAGGTLILEGSHILVQQFLMSRVAFPRSGGAQHELLSKHHPWLHELFTGAGDQHARLHRLMDIGTTIDDVKLRVIELTGTAGDIVIMHPWCFHSPSPNCGSRPRLMTSVSVARNKTAADHDPSQPPSVLRRLVGWWR